MRRPRHCADAVMRLAKTGARHDRSVGNRGITFVWRRLSPKLRSRRLVVRRSRSTRPGSGRSGRARGEGRSRDPAPGTPAARGASNGRLRAWGASPECSGAYGPGSVARGPPGRLGARALRRPGLPSSTTRRGAGRPRAVRSWRNATLCGSSRSRVGWLTRAIPPRQPAIP